MLNIIIGLAAGALVQALASIWLVWWQGLPPAIIVAVGVYYYLTRMTWKKVEALIKEGTKVLEPLSQRPELARHPEKRSRLVDEAIKKLKEGYAYAKWQPFVKSQINAQIGVILFSIKQDMNEAFPYLQDSFKRNWVSQAMLAVYYLRKHKPDVMEKTFETAVGLNKKEDLLWNLFAFCMDKLKKRDKAIEILGRARKHLPKNQHVIDNLVALQNDRKMKMKGYGDQWYQFMLEKPPAQRVRQPRFGRH